MFLKVTIITLNSQAYKTLGLSCLNFSLTGIMDVGHRMASPTMKW